MSWCLTLTCLLAGSPEVVLNRPEPQLVTGRQFDQALALRTSVVNEHDTLRHVIQGLGEIHRISILLDGRIDPTQTVSLHVRSQPLAAVLKTVAERIGGGMTIVGNVVYLGPQPAADKLRTLERLRSTTIFAPEAKVSRTRRLELSTRKITLHWNDLDQPRDLVARVGERFQLAVENPEEIPHDLWAGATLPDVTATEVLSMLLIPFDLTFRWTRSGRGIELVPVPQTVSIAQFHSPRGPEYLAIRDRRERAAKAAADWTRQLPGLSAEPDGDTGRVLVHGTVEQHKRLEELIDPDKVEAAPVAEGMPPIRRRRFTLRVRNVPVQALMQKLEETGVRFRFDAEQLENIDWQRRIDVDARNAEPAEFFRTMFAPLGLEFAIDEHTVTLTPAP